MAATDQVGCEGHRPVGWRVQGTALRSTYCLHPMGCPALPRYSVYVDVAVWAQLTAWCEKCVSQAADWIAGWSTHLGSPDALYHAQWALVQLAIAHTMCDSFRVATALLAFGASDVRRLSLYEGLARLIKSQRVKTASLLLATSVVAVLVYKALSWNQNSQQSGSTSRQISHQGPLHSTKADVTLKVATLALACASQAVLLPPVASSLYEPNSLYRHNEEIHQCPEC